MKYISLLPTQEYQDTFPRSLSLCGSTGSIGSNALKIVDRFPDLFKIIALGAGKNIKLLAEQATKYKPAYLAVQEENLVKPLRQLLTNVNKYNPEILFGQEGYECIASLDEVSTVLSAQVGAAGLRSTLAAARKGKVIALANKESLVLAGALLRKICEETQAVILPVDSEHHALFECLQGHNANAVKRLILTASGGPFRGKTRAFLEKVKVEDALKHPNWNMGAKITIDSATLMNKGLEVIEACYLYGMEIEKVSVLVHPQSVVHSMVEYCDCSSIAQLSSPDMRLPIAHCLAYPLVLDAEQCDLPALNLEERGSLTFEAVNGESFPCLNIARTAYKEGKCVALNAANEVAVDKFLNKEIRFVQISQLISFVLDKSQKDDTMSENILELDAQYRAYALEYK